MHVFRSLIMEPLSIVLYISLHGTSTFQLHSIHSETLEGICMCPLSSTSSSSVVLGLLKSGC